MVMAVHWTESQCYCFIILKSIDCTILYFKIIEIQMEVTVFQMPLNLFLLMEFNEMIHKQEQLSLVFFVTYVCVCY